MASARQAGASWDAPTRLFHWTLALLVAFSFTTGLLGGSWLPWHMKSGYGVLALLLFRIAWGFAGPPRARFADFVRGPHTALAHLSALFRGAYAAPAGHTPLGGWMVLAMLAVLAAQAATGLFSNDESSHEGPLAAKVSEAMVDRLSVFHGYGKWAVGTLVFLHVAAIVAYRWRLEPAIVRRMLGGPPPDASTALRAAALLAGAAALVYALVVVYPAR